MYDIYAEDSVSHASGNGNTRTLDAITSSSMMSVYCNCGRIVVQDRSEMRLKLELGKELQCMTCRNARISEEIDAMNRHFEGVPEDDGCIL